MKDNAAERKTVANYPRIKVIAICSMLMALAFVLAQIKLYKLPQGGSFTAFSMFMITFIGYLYGARVGFLAAFTFGLLKFSISTDGMVAPWQVLLDYPLAFGALGISGFFRKNTNSIVIGYIIACMFRFFFHFISGMVFYASYTPKGWGVELYSFWYNMSYILPEMIVTIAVFYLPPVTKAIKYISENYKEDL